MKDNLKQYGNYANTKNKTQLTFLQLPKDPKSEASLFEVIEYEDLRKDMTLDEWTKDRFRQIIKEYAAKDRLAKHWVRHKQKLLMYGKPGNGKTMWAEYIAHNVWLPLVKVRADVLVTSLLWGTMSNLRRVFDFAISNDCVMLIDEFDIIAKERSMGTNDHSEYYRTTNMLLILMDEFRGNSIIVCTTNLDKNIDKALYRRFDDIIEIKTPTEDHICRLLIDHISPEVMSKDLDIPWIATKLLWNSCAIVVETCKNVIKHMVLENQKKATNDMFDKYISEIYSRDI